MIENSFIVGGNRLIASVAPTDLTGTAIAGPTGLYHVVSLATTNAALIKASYGRMWALSAFNTTAADKFIKLFNKSTAPVPGTDTPVKTFRVPANGSVVWVPGIGSAFNLGLGVAIVGAAADLDATAVAAGDVILDIDWA